MLAMHLLGAIQQIGKRQLEQGFHFRDAPALRCGGTLDRTDEFDSLGAHGGFTGYDGSAAAHHPRKGECLSILNHKKLNISSIIGRLMPAQPCVLCGGMSHDGLWCQACDRALPYLSTACCPVCALPTPHSEICGHCLQHPPLFTHASAAFAYAFPVDKLVQAMKYREQLALAEQFAGRLAQRIDTGTLPDLLLPMPLHPNKLRERGFNQAQLLAGKLSRELKIELAPHVCRRVRDTPPQSALRWQERKKNMRKAFLCNTDMTGKHVALIDDVLTSGASLNALAEAVLERGAATVSVWVVARTLPH